MYDESCVALLAVYFIIIVLFYLSDSVVSFFFFFFFQAEDGIRDYKVTGVQTCALPISPAARQLNPVLVPGPVGAQEVQPLGVFGPEQFFPEPAAAEAPLLAANHGPQQIGRASCRERV